ncbi:hypothetical protein [Natrinema sp. 1APR25-10V2]|uniref:ATP-binding protein n=1 Tax=Natrinema sp. 1APR25-10V2 TaxID=2951081 RepID=UPI00287588F6|nr:hypothetical protein [Natrinema sp. 1APR25-10V2]MDS0476832.1 hypothetical protein [Natrinema sp. 1APR25-10V2]
MCEFLLIHQIIMTSNHWKPALMCDTNTSGRPLSSVARRQDMDRPPNLERLLRFARQTDLLHDPTVQTLLAATTTSQNPFFKRQTEKVLATRAIQRYRHPFDDVSPVVPPAQDRLTLGTTITGSTFDLLQDDLTEHLLAIGQSGAGKTTLFYNLMDQITVPYWVFDLKQDYRHRCHDEDLLVLPWSELNFNPLQPPPGVGPRRWAQVFSEMFGHATALLSGSKNYLMRQVIDLYRLYGLFDAVEPPYPSLHELQQFIEADKINYVRKAANYRDTVLNRLEAMTLTAGTVFDCSEGYPLTELLEWNVVFEFDGLGTDLQNFLMETLFAAVYEYRVAQNQRGGDLRHVFFLDEGKQVFSVYKERQDAAGIPAIDNLTAKMREFGEGLVVADQEATKLTDSIKANTRTKLLLATGDATQFREVAAAMDLSERQATAAQRLGTGEAIVQTGNREPCPVHLDNYELEKTISNTALQKIQQQEWNELSATPRDQPEAFLQEATSSGTETDEPVIPDDPQDDLELSAAAERLLTDIVEHPFTPLTERYDRFENVYQGNKAKTELVEAGAVEEQPITVDGENHKLLDLTDRGRTYAGTELDLEIQQKGRGGIEHRYWQHRLVQLFEAASWAAKRELFDADVYVNMQETELVVEVAMGDNPREVEHVQQHREQGFDAVWVVCRNATVKEGLEQRLAEHDLLEDCVTVRTVSEVCGDENASLQELGWFG